jgi:hypothetical protein
MKTVRTLIIETNSDTPNVQETLSTFDWFDQERIVDRNRIFAGIQDLTVSGLRDKEKRISKMNGVKSCNRTEHSNNVILSRPAIA